jgi:hypothetical protein
LRGKREDVEGFYTYSFRSVQMLYSFLLRLSKVQSITGFKTLYTNRIYRTASSTFYGSAERISKHLSRESLFCIEIKVLCISFSHVVRSSHTY